MKQKGFITVACNTQDINYLDHAYQLAVSIKDTQKEVTDISVIINDSSKLLLEDKHYKIFDNIIPVFTGKFNFRKSFIPEYKVCFLTPYEQTIKVESDIIMTSCIDHWWSILDEKDIVLTSKVMTYWGDVVTNRSQRRLFDDNDLPDVYSAIYYVRPNEQSHKFFDIVTMIFKNWAWFRDHYLKNCRYEFPVTDEVFAIAAKIYGVEKCTLNKAKVPTFVHMKNELQKISTEVHWYEHVDFEKRKKQISVGYYNQFYPLHYNDKSFLTLLEKYND